MSAGVWCVQATGGLISAMSSEAAAANQAEKFERVIYFFAELVTPEAAETLELIEAAQQETLDEPLYDGPLFE